MKKNNEMEKIVITGTKGFIGSNLSAGRVASADRVAEKIRRDYDV